MRVNNFTVSNENLHKTERKIKLYTYIKIFTEILLFQTNKMMSLSMELQHHIHNQSQIINNTDLDIT